MNPKLDFPQFYRNCNPTGSLPRSSCYIDFSEVRGESVIEKLKTKISLQENSTQLFTGHIGCGKSTELRELKRKLELEENNFHVVYFESDNFLNMGDVDITDILLVIARQVSESLETTFDIKFRPSYFEKLKSDLASLLQTEVALDSISLPTFLGNLTLKAKGSDTVRSQLRQKLEPQTSNLFDSLNTEILQPATEQLIKKQNKKGLVVIVDNLERIANSRTTASDKSKAEYLFVERGDQLKLNCHVVYTIPLALGLSKQGQVVKQVLGNIIKLPMVATKYKDGREWEQGITLLKQMVMTRAFPQEERENVLNDDLIQQIFENSETLEQLCRASGGHVRNLLSFLQGSLTESQPHLPVKRFQKTIRDVSKNLCLDIQDNDWKSLKSVFENKEISGVQEHESLLRSLLIMEYDDPDEGSWFAINPALELSDRYKTFLD